MMDWVWIRPDWLWALLPWLALAIFLKAYRPRQANWHQLIAPHLQTKLVEPARRGGTTQTILLWAALLSIIALAGPSVRTQPSPLFSAQQARVVLMDMSLSMWATDVTPNRLTRLRYKAMDFLKLSKGGETGLIAYAGDAFVVSPLTADTKTLTNLMSALAPDVMPAFGSRPDLAVKKAIELLHQAGHHKGSLVLMTDGIGQEEADQIEQLLSRTDFKLHIYQIGSEMGAPIQLPNGELLKSGGQIQLPTSDFSISRQLSVRHGGSFITLTSDTTDIHYLADASQASASSQAERQQQSAQTREDAGPYLLGVILILVLSLFRKGAFALIACCAVWQPQPAHAMG